MNTLLIMLFTLQVPLAFSQDSQKRSKDIHFEDEVVEGINRKPLDSVNQISERDGKDRPHLYRKRAGFKDLERSMLEEMRLRQ